LTKRSLRRRFVRRIEHTYPSIALDPDPERCVPKLDRGRLTSSRDRLGAGEHGLDGLDVYTLVQWLGGNDTGVDARRVGDGKDDSGGELNVLARAVVALGDQ